VEIERGDADAPRHALHQPERENRTDEHPDADGDGESVLADPERLDCEHRAYRVIVGRDYGVARDQWAEAVPGLRAAWEKIREKYEYSQRKEPIPQPDNGGWHGKGDRALDAAQNDEIDRGYARIREVAEQTIIPGVLSVEADDPTRRLVGFDNRFKGKDRLKEKIADEIRSTPGTTPTQALAVVPDAVRFTYLYSETAYVAGTRNDVAGLEARGFVQVERRNTWTSDQYKGINARWREPKSGVLFEVQFHTQASHEAKELTHKAYERIRTRTEETLEANREAAELKEFQREVNVKLPIPPGVTEYEDYRLERRNGRGD
jgi:hypothetical protein